jgi:hypothetical protein
MPGRRSTAWPSGASAARSCSASPATRRSRGTLGRPRILSVHVSRRRRGPKSTPGLSRRSSSCWRAGFHLAPLPLPLEAQGEAALAG